MRDSKTEVLLHYWDKILAKVLARAKELRDDKVKEIIKEIEEVPVLIKIWVITDYIMKCKEVY